MADQDVPQIVLDEAEILADGEQDVKEEQVESQQTTTEESSTNEKKEAEVVDSTEETEGEPAEPSQDDSEDELPDETKAEAEQPRGKADERKEQLNGEIRDLVAQRNALQQEVERVNAQVYSPQSIEQLMNEQGISEDSARIAAMEQRIELNEYNSRVAEAQLTIGHESEKVLNDFPIFNSDSPQYNPALAERAASLLQANLVMDNNTGQVIGSNVSPYDLYKTIYDATQTNTVNDKIAGQRAAEKMLASTDPVSSAPPKEKKEDPFLSGLMGGLN